MVVDDGSIDDTVVVAEQLGVSDMQDVIAERIGHHIDIHFGLQQVERDNLSTIWEAVPIPCASAIQLDPPITTSARPTLQPP